MQASCVRDSSLQSCQRPPLPVAVLAKCIHQVCWHHSNGPVRGRSPADSYLYPEAGGNDKIARQPPSCLVLLVFWHLLFVSFASHQMLRSRLAQWLLRPAVCEPLHTTLRCLPNLQHTRSAHS